MKNLKEETLSQIKYSGHTEKDVIAVVDDYHKMKMNFSWFTEVAKKINYVDDGNGALSCGVINRHLRIVFNDGTWLERQMWGEFEHWKYVDKPICKIDEYTEHSCIVIC